uniref:RING-type domain-containing protein n=1 Tax=Oreochromis niloticus TaxID=8128 RepID=A0A669DIX9_ORENI
ASPLQGLSQIEDLCCPVCQEVFRDPVLLSCSHSFCKDCLKRWWRERPTRECPVCKRRSSKYDPPLNRALKNLCEFRPIDEAAQQHKKELQETLESLKKKLKLYEELHRFLAEEEEIRLAALRQEEEQKSGMMKEKMEALISSRLNQTPSCAAWLKAIYSASAVESATVACFLLSQLTAPPASRKMFPVVEPSEYPIKVPVSVL